MAYRAAEPRIVARYQPLVLVLAALAAGILVDRLGSPSWWLWWKLAAVFWLAWLLLLLARRDRLAALALLAAVGAVAGGWHHWRWNLYPPDEAGRIARMQDQPSCVEAVLLARPRRLAAAADDPMRTLPNQPLVQMRLRLTAVRDGGRWLPVSGLARLTFPGRLDNVFAGDRLRILAFLRRPPPPANPGQFDVARHWRTRRELCQLWADGPEYIRRLSRGSAWHPRRWLDWMQRRCDEALWSHISPRRAALASAILLGAREQIDRQRNEEFFVTGTVHLLAISGLHVGILAYLFWLLARTGLVSRHWALAITAVFVLLYAPLVGARPPVVRAAILIVLVCVGRLLGRRALSFNSLATAGIIVLAINPAQLFQTGTQLSFLAVATLACCPRVWMGEQAEDPLQRLIARSRPWPVRVARRLAFDVWRVWLASTCVWLVALPLVLYRFHLLSPVAVLLNPLLTLPVAAALFAGFGVLLFGWLLPPLGALFGWLCDGSLWLIEACIHAARPLPGSHLFLPAPAPLWVLATYCLLAAAVAWPSWRPPRRWSVALLLVWSALGLVTTDRWWHRPRADCDQVVCTFLSLGHGTSVVVELPGGQTLLYDAGHMGSAHAAARAISGYLLSRGIRHVDGLVLSHADADHYNAVPELLERISVGSVLVPPVMFRDAEERPSLAMLRRVVSRRASAIRFVSSGTRLRVTRGVDVRVLHPPPAAVAGTDNASSIVLQVQWRAQRLLLPGDLEGDGMDRLLDQRPRTCHVVMAPHHGSTRSNPRGFALWARPRWVVISGSRRDRNVNVVQAFARCGAEVISTADGGAVCVRLGGGTIDVRRWQEDRWRRVNSSREQLRASAWKGRSKGD